MQTHVGHIEPLFELKGFANRIDLSAWISGLSFTLGLTLCNHEDVATELLDANTGLYVVVTTIAIFLVSVLCIQRHMQLSVLANCFAAPRQLVTNGVFRYTRNPIYVAFFIPLSSIAYFSPTAMIAAMGIYVLAMNLTVIRKEERDLLEAFGTEYKACLESTPRWIF